MTSLKRSALAALAAAPFGFVPSAAPASTTSSNLSVTATVTANCTVSTAAVGFGNVNTISGSNVDATGSITVTCTNGSAWSAAANVGGGTGATFASRKMAAGANLLNYSLYTDSARTTVWGDGSTGNSTLSGTGNGSAQAVTVYGRIGAGQTGVLAGSYSDTVSVTVTY